MKNITNSLSLLLNEEMYHKVNNKFYNDLGNVYYITDMAIHNIDRGIRNNLEKLFIWTHSIN